MDVWRISMGCPNDNLVRQDSQSLDISQDMSSQDRSSQDRSSQDRTGQDRAGQLKSGLVRNNIFLDPTIFILKIFLDPKCT